MFSSKPIMFLITCTVFGSLCAVPPTPAFAAENAAVEFRLTQWKSAHFDDENVAKTRAATLRKIGCEVEQAAHGDHFDVSYRCPQWRSITLRTHDAAHQWERWLQANGFQTSHHH